MKERSPELEADVIARNPLEEGVLIRMLTIYKEINQDLITNWLLPNALSQIPRAIIGREI